MCCFSWRLTPKLSPSWADREVGIQLISPEPKFFRLPNSPKGSQEMYTFTMKMLKGSFRPPKDDTSFPEAFLFCFFWHLSDEALPRNNTAFILSVRLFPGKGVRLLLLFPALRWSESRLLLVWRCLWWQCKWKQNTIITCHDNIAPSIKHNATVYKAKYTTGKFEYIFHRLRSENYIKLFRGRNKLQRIWEKGPYSSFQRRIGLCAEYI